MHTESADSDNFVSISTVFDEMEKDLLPRGTGLKKGEAFSGKKAILEILAKAAGDHRFQARLTRAPEKVPGHYDLTLEERAVLASGGLKQVESWIVRLDKRPGAWIWCRFQQEKW